MSYYINIEEKEVANMIKSNITVEYMIEKETNRMVFDLSELATETKKGWEFDTYERSITFTSFKNDGTISKSQRSLSRLSDEDAERIYAKAESMLAEQLKVQSETATDMERALELKAIVDAADFNGKMVTIKTKNSHSKWYQHGGEGHMVSFYHTQVPVAVEDEARELQALRKKHQGDSSFDFYATAYKTVEVRIADHDNYKEEY